eukprot:1145913-Pelagomonas_calceolata.AAC.2
MARAAHPKPTPHTREGLHRKSLYRVWGVHPDTPALPQDVARKGTQAILTRPPSFRLLRPSQGLEDIAGACPCLHAEKGACYRS